MRELVEDLAAYVREAVSSAAFGGDSSAELRSVFHGPSGQILEELFAALTAGEGLVVPLPDGKRVSVPVLLQVDRLVPGTENPAIGASGRCDENHLLTLRNSPDSPRYLALVPPGHHRTLSVSSATRDFGVSNDRNSGQATIEDWWSDHFIQDLVRRGISRGKGKFEAEPEHALPLLRAAIEAADEVGGHEVSRSHAWAILSRLFEIPPGNGFGERFSAVCGAPPTSDGSIHANEQLQCLRNIASAFESGLKAGLDAIKRRSATVEGSRDALALEDCITHLRACDLPTSFERATSFYYSPIIAERGPEAYAVPDWWSYLTVDRWADLLQEDTSPTGAVSLECANSLVPAKRGMPAIVTSVVELKFATPETADDNADILIQRESKPVLQWNVSYPGESTVSDSEPPNHRSPLRYSASGSDLKKATIKVVSLDSWLLGVYPFSRTATKVSPPKPLKANKEKISLECAMVMAGAGRHYLDIYVGPNVEVRSAKIGAENSVVDEFPDLTVARVTEHAFGVEVDIAGDCHCDVVFDRGNGPEILRVGLEVNELATEGSNSEFERLIKLNRQPSGGASSVQVNRQSRLSQLETWSLDVDNVASSFYPIVLAPDYASDWRPPDWKSAHGSILSRGRFLHDPRPAPTEFTPPPEFIAARTVLAGLIRGDDHSGLVEGAPLGDWLTTNQAFLEAVNAYISSYETWLESEPEIAAWVDVALVCSTTTDGMTLSQEPDAIFLSPLHPIKLAWQAVAQKALFQAIRTDMPSPAASILDPTRVPDILHLPLRTPTGSMKWQAFLSLESNSDYWSVLWNGDRLENREARTQLPPFDREFGLQVGGASGGFSISQIERALDDVATILGAKPIVSVAISSSSSVQASACDAGLMEWAEAHFSASREGARLDPASPYGDGLGRRLLHIYDYRTPAARPDDAALANIAEDTGNSVRWFAGSASTKRPDLGIIAQLETAQPSLGATDLKSPLGFGGLIRHRVRQQLATGSSAFLTESRMGEAGPPTGDGIIDRLSSAIARLENLGGTLSYTFAPSVHAIKDMLQEKSADFVAVSSSSVDPACFLGGWLEDAYLWDYNLPSYSRRAGDTNGYYLLSKVKQVDRDLLKTVVGRLPGLPLDDEAVDEIVLEVARRGIPTVRGLSSGNSGASGDLGLFLAARILQDQFRPSQMDGGLLPSLQRSGDNISVALVVPVDPFWAHIGDIQRSVSRDPTLRADLFVIGVHIAPSSVQMRITPVEVKYRNGSSLTLAMYKEALGQAADLGKVLDSIRRRADNPDHLLWQLTLQHLLVSIVSYGFRVYSQQMSGERSKLWANCHQRLVGAILSGEVGLEIDKAGRLIVMDASNHGSQRDTDEDGQIDTIILSPTDCAQLLRGDPASIHAAIRAKVGDWRFMPTTPLRPNVQPAPHNANDQHIVEGAEGEAPKTEEPKSAKNGGSPASGETTVHPLAGGTAAEPESVPAPPAPPSIVTDSQGIEILVGTKVDALSPTEQHLNLSDTALNQLNIGVVGDLGTGKTQFLKSLIYQTRSSQAGNDGFRPRFLIFDYKKDYSVPDFVAAAGVRVVEPRNLPINIFDVGHDPDPTAWLGRYKFLSDVLDKIWTGVGPVQRQNLKQAIRLAYEHCSGRQPTIYDVHEEYRRLVGSKPDSVFSILDDIVDGQIFSRDPSLSGSVEDFLDGAVVIQLDSLGQDDRTKNMVVAIMLNVFYEHMLKIPKRPYRGINPQLRVVDSFLLVDEADNIMRYEFDVLRKILLQGREFGVGVILASQYLRHFKTGGTDYREPLLTWFIHKVPNITAIELGALGLTADLAHLAERVKTLPNHQCLFKTASTPGEIVLGEPFYRLLRAGGRG